VLTEAIEPNGQLIVSIVPEVEFIIGKQPPVPDLQPRDACARPYCELWQFKRAHYPKWGKVGNYGKARNLP
jgi:hypothetical protein